MLKKSNLEENIEHYLFCCFIFWIHEKMEVVISCAVLDTYTGTCILSLLSHQDIQHLAHPQQEVSSDVDTM